MIQILKGEKNFKLRSFEIAIIRKFSRIHCCWSCWNLWLLLGLQSLFLVLGFVVRLVLQWWRLIWFHRCLCVCSSWDYEDWLGKRRWDVRVFEQPLRVNVVGKLTRELVHTEVADNRNNLGGKDREY